MPNECTSAKTPVCAFLQQLPQGAESTPELALTAWYHLVTQYKVEKEFLQHIMLAIPGWYGRAGF